MEAKLDLADGFKGTVKSMPGERLRIVIEAPDTGTNRAYLLDCLFQLQTARLSYTPVTDKGGRFPNLSVEAPHARMKGPDGYACFTLREDRYDGGPVFFTLGATQEDLHAAHRAEICMNRHSGMTTPEILEMAHAQDCETAYRILLSGFADVLSGKYGAEDLKYVYDEARRFHDPNPELEPFPAPAPRNVFEETDRPRKDCHYCPGILEDAYLACPFKGYRPGECFKLTGIIPSDEPQIKKPLRHFDIPPDDLPQEPKPPEEPPPSKFAF